MKLFFYNEKINFGDTINPWFWSHFIEPAFQEHSDELFVGIGTLLNNRLPGNYREVHIMGSGAGYGDFVPTKRDNWKIHCLRGPLTANALGVDEKLAIADPAILINELISLDKDRAVKVGFMPHLTSDSVRLKKIIEASGILYVSPSDDPSYVIAQVNKCERFICSAMHGAILADALRVPWYPVSTLGKILAFKWQDWFSSMQIDASLHTMPPLWPNVSPGLKGKISSSLKNSLFKHELRKIVQNGKFVLSKDEIFEQRKYQLKEAISKFNAEYKGH